MVTPSATPLPILYLNKTAEIGGAEISLFSLLKGLDKERFLPAVLLPSKGPFFKQLVDANIEVKVFPLCGFRKGIRWTMPYLRSVNHIKSMIRDGKFHLVHINTAGATQYGIIAAKLAKVPVISHRRSVIDRRCFYLETCFLADAFVANSKAVEVCYRRYLRSNQKSVVIYNGIDLEHYPEQPERGAEIRRRYGISPETFVVGVIGRICRAKGHDILLEAVNHVCRVWPDLHVLIVGDETTDGTRAFAADLDAFISRNHLYEKITFTGFMNNVFPIYGAIDLLVHPSVAEGFGRIFIEAMAASKPVVATRVGGTPEVVKDGVTGILVPPNDPTEMAKAILRIIHNKRLAKRMGIEGRRRVKALFTINRNVELIQQFYLETLQYC